MSSMNQLPSSSSSKKSRGDFFVAPPSSSALNYENTSGDCTKFTYPSNSPYKNALGYLGNLTDDHEEALEKLQQWLIEKQIEISKLASHTLHPTLLLLRYLRSNSFSVEKTFKHIQDNVKWRLEMNAQALSSGYRPESILNITNMSGITSIFPHWHCGYDRVGRPVLYKQYGKFDCTKLLKLTSIENLLKYHTWEQEACMELCKRQSIKSGCIVETLTAVIDVKNMVLSQVTSDFLSIIKGIAKIDQAQYPETLGRFFIINTPFIFPVVWKGVKIFLDPVVAGKIEIFGCNENDWKSRLDEYIGFENMPSNYGGRLPELNASRHPYEDIITARQLDATLNMKSLRTADRQIDDLFSEKSSERGGGRSLDARSDVLSIDDFRSADDGVAGHISVGKMQHESALDILGNSSPSLYRGWEQEIKFINYIMEAKKKSQNSLSANIHGWSTANMTAFLKRSIAVHLLITLVSIVMSSVDLSTVFSGNSGDKHLEQIWSAILVLFVGSFVEIIGFVGYISVSIRNHPLLLVYIVTMTLFEVILFSMIIITFTNADGNLLDNVEEEYVKQFEALRRYNLILGISCLLMFLFSLLPLLVSFLFERRMREEHKHDQLESLEAEAAPDETEVEVLADNKTQLKVVLKISSVMSVASALVMLSFGTYALHFLNQINFNEITFAIYALIFCGVLVLLTGLTVWWASITRRIHVVNFLYLIASPVTIGILIFSSYNAFSSLNNINELIEKRVEDGTIKLTGDMTTNDCKVSVLSQLLVTGVMCSFFTLLEAINIVTGRQMIVNRKALKTIFVRHLALPTTKRSYKIMNHYEKKPNSLGFYEKCVVLWALLLGLFCIFFYGTYTIFSTWASKTKADKILSDAWNGMGSYDERYLESNGYLVVSRGLLALVGGPSVLFYGVAIIEDYVSRHVVGIICCVLFIQLELLYYTIELHTRRYFNPNNEFFILSLIFSTFFFLIVPAIVLYKEVVFVKERIGTAKKYDIQRSKTRNSDKHVLISPYRDRDVHHSVPYRRFPVQKVSQTGSTASMTTGSQSNLSRDTPLRPLKSNHDGVFTTPRRLNSASTPENMRRFESFGEGSKDSYFASQSDSPDTTTDEIENQPTILTTMDGFRSDNANLSYLSFSRTKPRQMQVPIDECQTIAFQSEDFEDDVNIQNMSTLATTNRNHNNDNNDV